MTKCAICRTEYKKWSMTQKVCLSPECALEWARRERIKREKKAGRELANQTKLRRQALMTRPEQLKKTQAACNAFVRARDWDQPCISCGITTPVQWHAGHFLSRGAHPELALNPRNIFRQCSQCNDYLSGNQLEARKGIIARMGQAEMDWLEGPHESVKYSMDDLVRMEKEFKIETKLLKGKL